MKKLSQFILSRGQSFIKTLAVLMFFTAVQSVYASSVLLALKRADAILNGGNLPVGGEGLVQLNVTENSEQVLGFNALNAIAPHDSALFKIDGVNEEVSDQMALQANLKIDAGANAFAKTKAKTTSSASPTLITKQNSLSGYLTPLGGGTQGLDGAQIAPEYASNGESVITPCTASSECQRIQKLKAQALAALSQDGPADNGIVIPRREGTLVASSGIAAGGGISGASHTGDGPLTVTSGNRTAADIINSKLDAKKAAENGFVANPTLAEFEKNQQVFKNAPEGWLVEDSNGITIRGALDKPFDKNNPLDNYIQIVVTAEAIARNPDYKNLKPGVYTIKKCEAGCYKPQYDLYANYLKALETNPAAAKPAQLPGEVETRTELFGFDADFIAKSQKAAAEFARLTEENRARIDISVAERGTAADVINKKLDARKKGMQVKFMSGQDSLLGGMVWENGRLVKKAD